MYSCTSNVPNRPKIQVYQNNLSSIIIIIRHIKINRSLNQFRSASYSCTRVFREFWEALREFITELRRVYGSFWREWMWILNVRFNSNPFYKHAWPHSLYPFNIQVENLGEEDSFTKWNRVVQIRPWFPNRGQSGITAWTQAVNNYHHQA